MHGPQTRDRGHVGGPNVHGPQTRDCGHVGGPNVHGLTRDLWTCWRGLMCMDHKPETVDMLEGLMCMDHKPETVDMLGGPNVHGPQTRDCGHVGGA